MALTLTSADRTRFEAASRALLSPLAAPEPDQTCRSALDRLSQLFAVDRAAFLFPEGDRMRILARGFDADTLEKWAAAYAGAGGGTNRYTDPYIARMMQSIHENQLKVWNLALAERVSGIPRERFPFYHDVALPAGMANYTTAGVSLAQGKALVGVLYDDPENGRFSREKIEVLRLLYPAIEAGIHAIRRFAHRRDTLSHALENASEGIMIYDGDGRELHHNRTLCRFLSDDPRPDALVSAMRCAAERLLRLRSPGPMNDGDELAVPGTRVMQTPLSRYTVRANLLAPGMIAPDHAILVALERELPALPSPETLRGRFGLTKREVEVALLVARGHSNGAVAERLSRSPHTIRHHLEHIFGKLGIRSRQSMAMRLLGGSA